jgi:hypothetical protein
MRAQGRRRFLRQRLLPFTPTVEETVNSTGVIPLSSVDKNRQTLRPTVVL